MTIVSTPSSYLVRMQAANLAGTSSAPPLPGSIGTSERNNNDSTSLLFDIKAATASTTNWVIGASALDSILQFYQAGGSAAWSSPRAVMTICGPQAGAAIPSSQVIKAGIVDTGAPCTSAFLYTVGANDFNVLTGYSSLATKQRYCMWCSAPVGSTTSVNEVFLKEFTPPTTATRKLSGITVFAADSTGAINLSDAADSTATKQESVDVTGCGKASQTTKLNTKGQMVEFTMTMPTALA